MKRNVWLVVKSFAAIATIFGSAAFAQESQPRSSQDTSIKTKSEEVQLDVVVRDKKGRAANDLKAVDFQIFENGEPK